jgi:ATP-dependent protease ClpP protease subunit
MIETIARLFSFTFFFVSLLLLPEIAHAVHVKSDYIELTTSKVVYLYGDVSADSAKSFERQQLATLALKGDRVIVIDSPGGEVDAGQRMISDMDAERANGVKMICVVEARAHSMAFNLLTHCDVRLAADGSLLLFHKIARVYSACTLDLRGTPKRLRKDADDLEKADEPFRQANAKALAMSLRDYDAYADKDTLWRATTLVARGYLQGIATLEK